MKRFVFLVIGAAILVTWSHTAAAQGVPRLNGKPNFSGMWSGPPALDAFAAPPLSTFQGGTAPKKLTRREQGLKDIPLADWGREAFLYYTAADSAWSGETGGANDPRYHEGACGGPKSPADLGSNLMLYQTPEMVMITSISSQPWIRKIWIGQTNPSDLTELVPFWMGHSVAKWEGDTLVVDTVRIKEGTPLISRLAIPQSGNLQMTERFSFKDGKLQIDRIFEDLVAFTKPWSDHQTLSRQNAADARETWEVQENHAVCKPTGGFDWGKDDPWFENYDKLKKEILPEAWRLEKGLPPVPEQYRQQ